MVLIFASLLAGFILAQAQILPQSGKEIINKLGNLAFFLLLFFIGISLGGNSELILSLPVVGLKALVLSSSAVLGSVLLVWLLVKLKGNKL